jgi:hypothetical protein
MVYFIGVDDSEDYGAAERMKYRVLFGEGHICPNHRLLLASRKSTQKRGFPFWMTTTTGEATSEPDHTEGDAHAMASSFTPLSAVRLLAVQYFAAYSMSNNTAVAR